MLQHTIIKEEKVLLLHNTKVMISQETIVDYFSRIANKTTIRLRNVQKYLSLFMYSSHVENVFTAFIKNTKEKYQGPTYIFVSTKKTSEFPFSQELFNTFSMYHYVHEKYL